MTSPGFGQAQGVSTGSGASDAWGDSFGEASLTAEDAGELLPSGGHVTLQNGHVLKLSPERWRAMLHRPEAVDAVTARTEQLCDVANSLGEPLYKYLVQNYPYTTRCRGRVYPIAPAYENVHGNLLKATQNVPSDPIPQGVPVGPTEETGTQPPDTDATPESGTYAADFLERLGE